MALEEFRRGALRNKYSTHESGEGLMYIICFSSTTKFGAILSPALIFSLVLSFLSREKKERCQEDSTLLFQATASGDGCSFSFARPKESEPKEKGGLRKWSAEGGPSRPFVREAISTGDVLSFVLTQKKERKKKSRLWKNGWKLHRGAETNKIRS